MADKPRRVILFGDSITEMGVQKNGYVVQLKNLLAQKGKADAYDILGAGISGNKVYDLFLRADDDVLAKQPDVVVIYIGVNDVWHKASAGTGTDEDKFLRFYEALIKKFQAKGIRVICCTPAVIGERSDASNPQDGDLNQYAKGIRKLAAAYGCPLVDLRKAFLEYNQKNNPEQADRGILTTDRVHLNDKGNRLVAELIMAAL